MLIHLTIRTKTNLYFLSPLSLLPSHFLSLSLTPNTCTIHDNLVFNSNNGYFDMSMQYLFFKQVRLSNNYLIIYMCIFQVVSEHRDHQILSLHMQHRIRHWIIKLTIPSTHKTGFIFRDRHLKCTIVSIYTYPVSILLHPIESWL